MERTHDLFETYRVLHTLIEGNLMRADRLISLLMLLQTRGRMTAEKLAEELEVSVRTIYRDIEALSASGVPVYTEGGPGGGCALLEGYRTTLTGLTEAEVRALFMLNIPAPLAQLGVSHELKAALLKLTAALPAGRQADEEQVRQRIYIDSVAWFQGGEPVPHLQTVHQAIWEDRCIYLTYQRAFGAQVERLFEPYGLVAKAGVWYVVCFRDGRLQPHRVADLLAVSLSDQHFQRPADFNLAACWAAWCEATESDRPAYPVTVRVAPALLPHLPHYFGEGIRPRITQAEPPDGQGWMTLILPFETLYQARDRLLAFGGAVEVLEPEALRCSLADFARQIVILYEKGKN